MRRFRGWGRQRRAEALEEDRKQGRGEGREEEERGLREVEEEECGWGWEEWGGWEELEAEGCEGGGGVEVEVLWWWG